MGGPSREQKEANKITLSNAKDQQALGRTNAARQSAIYGEVNPFYSDRLAHGLPFYGDMVDYAGGTTARSFAPAEGDLERRLSRIGWAPSGFATASRSDLEAKKAMAFDDQLRQALFLNEQAKQQAAAGKAGLMQIVDPSRFYSGSTSASSVARNPLQSQPSMLGGILGGAVQGGLSALPF